MPSAKPKTNPKATIRFSSFWPKSRKIRTTRAGLLWKWLITMIFGSSSWSMCSPISSVTVRTTPGSWACTRAITACLAARGRSRHSVGCSRRMMSSIISGSSGSKTLTMCSAIWSGSSCW